MRSWATSSIRKSLVWVLLNPSTADANHDDPTIRRVIAFTRDADCDTAIVVNLFAYRATDPRELRRAQKAGIDAEGPEADEHIREAVQRSFRVVAGWGAPKAWADLRSYDVMEIVRELGQPLYCLGTTKDGGPKHPLYVQARTPLRTYR
jgi:hypothetical protein